MITVVICTHNPREDYLRRTLDGLVSQTLAKDRWELLLIDNRSHEPISDRCDLSWHPNARTVREDELGLTAARLRGIQEAKGDLLVFVDDDNVLEMSYLVCAEAIAKENGKLGAFGGSVEAEFERAPQEWSREYLYLLGAGAVPAGDLWSNAGYHGGPIPIGAGMCVRRSVGLAYSDRLSREKHRRKLDREGDLLLGGGDIDLALTAVDEGFGTGIFTSLRLKHLIAAKRLETSYLLRLIEGAAYSDTLLRQYRGVAEIVPFSRLLRIRNWLAYFRMSSEQRRARRAWLRGVKEAQIHSSDGRLG